MEFFHGVRAEKKNTSVSVPVTADTGIHFCVGTAPVQMVNGKVNEPILCRNYNEAVQAVGYSDDWEKYTLCEEIYAAFELYKIAPIVIVNVLDPDTHKKTITDKIYTVTDEKTIKLPLETIEGSVKAGNFKVDEDYGLCYTNDSLLFEILEGGAITESTVKITYDVIAPELVTKNDIIGGYDINSNKYKGLETIDLVMPKCNVIPEIVLCPGFSSDSIVAAVMSAKAEKVNGIFEGAAIIDADTKDTIRHTDVTEWKNSNKIINSNQIVVWPKTKMNDRRYHFSTHQACRMTATDTDENMGDGTPCESPSNKSLKIDSLVLHDGTEVLLDLTHANYLNKNGIVTAMNLIGEYVSWGNYTACYPHNINVADCFISVSRMFKWVGNSVILSTWKSVDKRLNQRLIESIIQSLNIWCNGLVSEEKILGGRIEYHEEENNEFDLGQGKAVYHVYMTPPSPAQEFQFLLMYDSSYLANIGA